MLVLKKINYEDIDKEYEAIIKIPHNENGFENKYYNVSKEKFKNEIIPKLLKNSEGVDLPEGYVPDTYFFLWNNQEIIGLFKIRHYLNDALKNGAGHIGYTILKNYRKNGYATKGLELAIEECKKIIKEDEIYLSSHKSNPSSLKVQIKCGAYLYGENEDEYFTRIKLKNDKNINFGMRDLKRNDWKRLKNKTIKIEDTENKYFKGKICLLTMKEVETPLKVNSPTGLITIADNNYKNIIIAPENVNWWLTVIFDANNNLIESYFDITRLNNFYDKENPFFIDMKLDVCIPYNHEPSIMDEDELKEILDNGFITNNDFNNAYATANKIIEFYNTNKEKYYDYIFTYLKKFL